MQQRLSVLLVAALAFCAVAGHTQRAKAWGVYAGVLGGYASTTSDTGNVEPYGVGLGIAGGVTIPVIPIYIGARGVWYFGDSSQLGSGSTTVKFDTHYVQYGIDLGYDLELGPIILRPQVGIGRAALDFSITGSSGGTTSSFTQSQSQGNSLYFAPGIGLILKAGLIFVGGELRYNALTESKGADSVSIFGSFGLCI